jgi:hypothetical protein
VKPIGPIVERILIRIVLARIQSHADASLWTNADVGRKSKGPERLEPRRACNLFNSPDDREVGVAATPFCLITIRRARGEACSLQPSADVP